MGLVYSMAEGQYTVGRMFIMAGGFILWTGWYVFNMAVGIHPVG